MENDEKLLIGLDLSMASKDVIETLIEDVSDISIFDEIARANTQRPEILQLLAACPDTPAAVGEFISGFLNVPVKVPEISEEMTREKKHESLTTKIQRLSVSERLQLAMKGGREIRGILARDANKQVMLGVLENGKITETEVEMIAKSRQVPEDALRKIAKSKEWMKNYSIAYGLVSNPKTPPGIAVTFVSGLKNKELVALESNKNVPELIRSAAKKLMSARRPH